MKINFLILTLLLSLVTVAQNNLFNAEEIAVNELIDGTLLTPNNSNKHVLAIIIAGSGPTNRDGNQNFLKNNSLKKLAEGISNQGIATFRYDKRIVKQIRKGKVDKNIMFDDYVTDAISVIDYFKEKKTFSKIYIIGHSQGSLIGMLAAKDKVDGYISLAGAGQSIDAVIQEQIEKNMATYTEDSKRVFAILKENKTTTDYPPALASVFDISLQPFMSNWIQYNPTEKIKELNIPILIINGTKDLQVTTAEATLLKEANLKAEIKIIENMNHILFTIAGDALENSKSYNESFRKINPEVIESIVSFIK
ncbi:alpha/beta hydrolase [Oceanihabitans sp. 2_MG-2023]|uniref:alpha/beta hydrolase family protein n=1 Tax=Oceanihabitans sp. 2_MG-2023 TaxID=3062661 RepID=UPI0026E16874|nr:alpha/beta fold hydrolase [Oceanihabitans sp. 2_MG-2023]MDO6597589.1 alpha/beta hydrolase [Oceanihabitans sp. 2_MG-2023]